MLSWASPTLSRLQETGDAGSTLMPCAYFAERRARDREGVDLDEERKAAMVSNLLVVLCSEQATQQVVNTGSLYQ